MRFRGQGPQTGINPFQVKLRICLAGRFRINPGQGQLPG